MPWIFEKGDKPSLVTSTVEALAILVSLKLRFGDVADTEDKRILLVPSVTDNRGNGAAHVHAFSLLCSTHGTGDFYESKEDENDRGMGSARM